VDFGQHGSLLSQPLIEPSTDSHSVQTDEKDLPNAAATTPTDKNDSEAERNNWVCAGYSRCTMVTLIILAVLLVVVAAIALPLWLVPSGTG